jgi:hypothetical protein
MWDKKSAFTVIRDKTWDELYIDGEIYPDKKKQYRLPHQQLSLIVTVQVNPLTYEPNHRSF